MAPASLWLILRRCRRLHHLALKGVMITELGLISEEAVVT
jgi:hypothetical protein